MQFRVDVYFHNSDEGGLVSALGQIFTKLGAIEAQGRQILMEEKLVVEKLALIDTATNQMAENEAAIGTIAQAISDEVDVLIAGQKAAGVSQELIDQATALSVKSDAIAKASADLVPVLRGIASKGIANPVPVPVPPVPEPPVL